MDNIRYDIRDNNVKYLEDNIVQAEAFIKDREERIAAGEEWLEGSLHTWKRHLKDLRKQLAEATQPAVQPELVG